ncbi:MAG TPA: hypothetical protein VIU82_12540 [Bosea sp. (in: a-proteobacteria)]
MLDRPHLPALRNGWRAVALALCAGAAMLAAPSPARAMDTDWHQTCTFKTSPQGYGDMARERACIRQNDCTAMADARGGMMMGMGCVGVAPDAPAAATRAAQPRQRH